MKRPPNSPKTADKRPATLAPAVLPTIALPKGGGALQGMGEKFATNPVTGTGTFSVPLTTTSGRSGFGPQLSLSYDSGAGNGPFGLGWTVGHAAITRKTDKGLPRYNDATDVFIFGGAEDLVPALREENGGWERVEETRTIRGVSWYIVRYRPRIESAFARIEYWRNRQDPDDSRWRTISRDNVTTWLGCDAESRVTDPDDSKRTFSWLVCLVHDDKGNAQQYNYARENGQGVDLSPLHETHRSDQSRSAARYLKRIKYGNRTPYYPESGTGPASPPPSDWMFEVVFDYGEHDVAGPLATDSLGWPSRPDPFSSYRSGFEVRMYRLCRRVLMFHHFPAELGAVDTLVCSSDLTFTSGSDDQVAAPVSLLAGITHRGYVRQEDGSYLVRSLPTLALEYSPVTISRETRDLDPLSLEHVPPGIDGSRADWVDLDGEGVPGLLVRDSEAWYYKRAAGADASTAVSGSSHLHARFGSLERLSAIPVLEDAGGRPQLIDLAADGRLDAVAFRGATPGFHTRTDDQSWGEFRPFASYPSLDWSDANLRFVDLTGDGTADILITEDDALCMHASLGEAGFAPAERVRYALDERDGPRVVFADGSQSIHLADMNGDGLSDLVRIRNGEVCYWPNLGYGRFGAKVAMDDAPWFDPPEQFEQARVRLADIDGSGAADIVYIAADHARLYFNRSGNAWCKVTSLDGIPRVNAATAVGVVDLLGRGTACLVWSSGLPADASRSLRYLDLLGGRKPHLLTLASNGLGAETRWHYAPSTEFYMKDKAAGRAWITRLPFPVHVVQRIETIDHVSRHTFVARYAYHHGYYDGVEREFCGFAMVEQFDTEAFTVLERAPEQDNVDAASHLPTVLTRTWFHTGALLPDDEMGRRLSREYFGAPAGGDPTSQEQDTFAQHLLADTVLPAELDATERREACRGLKGLMLRQEVYALDDSPAAARPYRITEQNASVRRLQPRLDGQSAVFLTHARETITAQAERGPVDDARVGHNLTLAVDDFGNVLRTASVGYGRRVVDGDLDLADADRQRATFITCVENRVTNAIDSADAHRTPVICETTTSELTGVAPSTAGRHLTIAEVESAFADAALIPYETVATAGVLQRRTIERQRTRFRADNLTSLLDVGVLPSLALLGEQYQLALTPGLVSLAYGTRVDQATLSEAGYQQFAPAEGWWLATGRLFLSDRELSAPEELAEAREHFFLPRRVRSPFGHDNHADYDGHDIAVVRTVDAAGNTATAAIDYRVMKPATMTDSNGNRSATAYDALALPVAVAYMGKTTEIVGDSLEGLQTDLDPAALQAHFSDPLKDPWALLGGATSRFIYDLFAFERTRGSATPQPPAVCAVKRETHAHALAPGERTKVQVALTYSDAMGREIQQKVQAEPGPVNSAPSSVRWVGSGWTIFNNKGLPVRQYEPFFSRTHQFEFARQEGVSPVLFYDPLGRSVATLRPDGSYDKVLPSPWHEQIWDGNDTVLLHPHTDANVAGFVRGFLAGAGKTWTTWHERRRNAALGPRESDAARQTEAHAGTPSVAHFDALGRPFLTVADNGSDEQGARQRFRFRNVFDVEGNVRTVMDAHGRVVMRHTYDMVGRSLHQASMEAGERWTLYDVLGQPIRTWDSRGQQVTTTYDALRRPSAVILRGPSGADVIVGRTEYGEAEPDAEVRNVRGRIVRSADQAGVITSEAYDFKGNLLRSRRQLTVAYKELVDWSSEVPLEPDMFVTATSFDALNRATSIMTPDGSVVLPTFNEAGFLQRLDARLRGATTATPFIVNVDYDAKGQRSLVEFGNGVRTWHEYDAETQRLRRIRSQRPSVQFPGDSAAPADWPGAHVQDLSYVYDPVGNITHVEDRAQQTIFFRNRRVDPTATYVYDPLYRLVSAAGREHLGQIDGSTQPPAAPGAWADLPAPVLQPGDGTAMGTYVERYVYDAVGNLLSLQHRGSDPAHAGWTRGYRYAEPSQLEPDRVSNRLSRTIIGDTVEPYAYAGDAGLHGCTTAMPHLSHMSWDFCDRLRSAARQAVSSGTPETTWFVYDAEGTRVRKITESAASAGGSAARVHERLYLGGWRSIASTLRTAP